MLLLLNQWGSAANASADTSPAPNVEPHVFGAVTRRSARCWEVVRAIIETRHHQAMGASQALPGRRPTAAALLSRKVGTRGAPVRLSEGS